MTFSGGTHYIDGLTVSIANGFGNDPKPEVYRAVILLTDGFLTSGSANDCLEAGIPKISSPNIFLCCSYL